MTKYELAVGAVFKNEAHILEEWIKHYIHHGVEHFYLINDGSSDDYYKIIEPFIYSKHVTLFNEDARPQYTGRQRDMYNIHILPHLHETQWLLMCDLDEFVWSEDNVDLRIVLKKCMHFSQIQFEHTIFGSNGLIHTPKYAVSSFTRRSSVHPTKNPGNRKYFVNSSVAFRSLNVHHASYADDDSIHKTDFVLLDPYWFRMNHYCCQSRDFWKQIKCTRGDADNYKLRTPSDFDEIDKNDVVDVGLLLQNETLYSTVP
jgi:hypothetical protein